jgi:phenylalanine ammonia-lyase
LHGSKLARLHEDEIGLEEDRYLLRQDRYPLRTAPQFLGPQVEDILSALAAITQECNSSKYLTFFVYFAPDLPFLL